MPNADYLEYYPNEEYLRKNWAPERIPLDSLRALAAAQRMAVKAKVLSPFLADKFLPNILIEGRHGSPGMETDDDTMRASYNPNIETSFGVRSDMQYSRQMIENMRRMGYEPQGGTDMDFEPYPRALSAAAMLGEKERIYGEGLAIERWNGIGPLAKKHVRKVDEMSRMLAHPKNQALRDAYQTLLQSK